MTTQMELWQRIKELDLQKSSGTLTDNQKAMIDERINSLIAELDDIANSNGMGNPCYLLLISWLVKER